MSKQIEKNYEEIIKKAELLNEKKFTETEVLKDVKAVLSDFYVAKVSLKSEKVELKFLNGQTFEITVKEK